LTKREGRLQLIVRGTRHLPAVTDATLSVPNDDLLTDDENVSTVRATEKYHVSEVKLPDPPAELRTVPHPNLRSALLDVIEPAYATHEEPYPSNDASPSWFEGFEM